MKTTKNLKSFEVFTTAKKKAVVLRCGPAKLSRYSDCATGWTVRELNPVGSDFSRTLRDLP
jgi:hypothetical protein